MSVSHCVNCHWQIVAMGHSRPICDGRAMSAMPRSRRKSLLPVTQGQTWRLVRDILPHIAGNDHAGSGSNGNRHWKAAIHVRARGHGSRMAACGARSAT